MEEEKENLHKKITDLEEENLKLKMQLEKIEGEPKSTTKMDSESVNVSESGSDSDTDTDSDSDSQSFTDDNINNECPEKIKDFCSNYESLTIIVNLINSENIKIIDENNNLEKLKILFNKNNNINNNPQFGGGFFNDLFSRGSSIYDSIFKDYINEFNNNLKLLLETPDVTKYENINNNNIIIEFLKSFHFQKDENLENFSVINYYHLLKESNNLLKLNSNEYTNYLKNNDYSNFKLLLLENYTYDFEIENNSFKLLSFLKFNTYYTINKKIIQLLEYYFKETSSLLNHKYIKIDTSDINNTSDTKQNFIITYQNSLSDKCDNIINYIYNETFEIFKIIKKYVNKNVKNLLDYDYKKYLYIENGKEYIKIDALKFDIPQDVKLQIDEEKPPENPDEESVEELKEEQTEEPVEEPVEEPTEEPIREPVEEPTEEPIRETLEDPPEDLTEEPTGEPIGEPKGEPIGEQTEEVKEEPKEEPIGEPIEEPKEDPIDFSKDPAKDPTDLSKDPTRDPEKKEVLGGKNKKTRKARY